MAEDQEYTLINDNDHNAEDSPSASPSLKQHSRSRRLSQAATFILIAATSSLLTFLFLNLLTPSSNSPSSSSSRGQHFGTCGPTATTALAHNCRYDYMMASWIPLPCYDAALAAEFLASPAYNFTWTSDPDPASTQQPVPLAEVQRGEHEHMYTTLEYHTAHCLYMWKRQARELLGQGGVGALDSTSWEYGHTGHCVETVASMAAVGTGGMRESTRVTTDFLECVRL